MKATDFRRDDCLVGNRRISYRTLGREWRCKHCGSRLVQNWDRDRQDWGIHCANSENCWRPHNFIHEAEWERRKADAIEVLDGLPPELAAQLK